MATIPNPTPSMIWQETEMARSRLSVLPVRCVCSLGPPQVLGQGLLDPLDSLTAVPHPTASRCFHVG